MPLSCPTRLVCVILLRLLLLQKAEKWIKDQTGIKDNGGPSKSLTKQYLRSFTIGMPTHVTSRADDTKGFMNLGCGEAIKLLFEHDGCSLNRQLGLPHVKTNSAPEWQLQLCGEQRNCKQMGKGNDPAAQTHCVCLCLSVYVCACVWSHGFAPVCISTVFPSQAGLHKITTSTRSCWTQNHNPPTPCTGSVQSRGL